MKKILDYLVTNETIQQLKIETAESTIPEDLEAYVNYLGSTKECILCESSGKKMWAQYGSYKADKCEECGLVWIDPMLTDAGLKRYYQDYIGMRLKDDAKTAQRNIQYELDKDFIETHITSGRVLDVGCSGGFFLQKLDSHFEKYGIELDDEAVSYARSNQDFGSNVYKASLSDVEFPDGYFDLVVMRGAIEHLPEPHLSVQRASALLKPGGFFFIAATPNLDSFSADLYREKWNMFHPIRHLYYFSPKTLSRLCAPHGLRLIAKDFPYLETPYASIEADHLEIVFAVWMKKIGRFDLVERSSTFWGNIMNLVFQK